MQDEELEELKRRKLRELIEKAKQKQRIAQAKVIVYSTPNCPYCALTKRYLRENGIEFVDYDVSTNVEKAREMFQKSGQLGVPVIDFNGRIIIGFDKRALDEEIAKLKND